MDQRMKGIGLFFAGWTLALTTHFLGALDTGPWVPLAVTGVEVIALIMMIVGIRGLSDQNKDYKTPQIFAVSALVASLGIGALQVVSMESITGWMGFAAIILALSGDVLFIILTGLILLDISSRMKLEGNELEANKLYYLWALFLTFAILYDLVQGVGVLLINEGLPALTYIVPVAGLPLLLIGGMLVVRVYRIHQIPLQQAK